MATFTGTGASETITTTTVSPTVTTQGGALPSDAADTINAGGGGDDIESGGGADIVSGGAGTDQIDLGAGQDNFNWVVGDGSDIVDGDADADTARFTGSSAAEVVELLHTTSFGFTEFAYDALSIVDMLFMERVFFNALGGADKITVRDLTDTQVTVVLIDLGGTLGGSTGDGQADAVTLEATANDNSIMVFQFVHELVVNGLFAQVYVEDFEKIDVVTIAGLGGVDTINAAAVAASGPRLILDGGAGNDILLGGEGNDTVIGGDGDDLAILGGGNDTFLWKPGDDYDVVEGGAGTDTLNFDAGNGGENISLGANASRVFFSAGGFLNLNSVERFDIDALGGSDTIGVFDLTTAGVTQVVVDLAGTLGGTTGDGQADTIQASCKFGGGTVIATAAGSTVIVSGLPAQIVIEHAEAANDRLEIFADAGNDVIDVSIVGFKVRLSGYLGNDTLAGGAAADLLDGGANIDTVDYSDKAAAVQLTLNGATNATAVVGGAAEDTVVNFENAIGGSGNDALTGDGLANVLTGGAGIDTLKGQGGNDTLDGGAGNDRLEGGAGDDTYIVNSAADVLVETSGTDTVRSTVSRTLAAGFEHLTLLGSAAINGTGNSSANTLTGNGGKNALKGSSGNDTVRGNGGDDTLDGGAGNDRLEGGSGNDTYVIDSADEVLVETSGTDTVRSTVSKSLASGFENLVLLGATNGTGNGSNNAITGNSGKNSLMGGDGSDTLIGGSNSDTLDGGAGNDRLEGGSGGDTLKGGTGKDVLVGGTSRDTMTGGSSADRFDFNAVNETGKTSSTRDIIKDFSTSGGDRIDLSTIDANGSSSGSPKFKFVKAEGADFTGVKGQLIWDKQTSGADKTVISGDINGDEKADFQIELTGLKSLTSGDFVL